MQSTKKKRMERDGNVERTFPADGQPSFEASPSEGSELIAPVEKVGSENPSEVLDQPVDLVPPDGGREHSEGLGELWVEDEMGGEGGHLWVNVNLQPMDRWTHLLDWLHSEHGLRDLHVECKDIPGELPVSPLILSKPLMLAFTGAGRGLYQTSSLSYNKFAPPPDVLAIPTTALLNVHTLRPHYPPDFSPNPISHKFKSKDTPAEEGGLYPLTATQLITLHLALHHPDRPEWTDSDVPPDPWAPFLRILPESFRWHHPLTWLVPDEEGVEDGMDKWRALERSLPEPTRILLKDVEKRFWEDVNVLRTVLVRSSFFFRKRKTVQSLKKIGLREQATHERYSTTSLSRTIPLSSFLWAWLNVNTRCLSFPLNLHPPGGSNDLTLAPILDMANHSSTSTPIPHTLPAAFPTSKATLYALPAAGGGDREVTLQYGPHDDGFLLAEYGFVCRPDAEGQGNEWNEVCVDRWVGELVDQLGEEEGGRRKRLLEETAYWGSVLILSSPKKN